jgi:large subunit ribosomal protein L22
MSPRKLRLVADMVRGKSVPEVLEFLPFVNKRAVKPVEKVIKSAAANAGVKGANPAELTVSSIEIMEGPRLKRFRPVSRGQAHGYIRQMSHIKVTVSTDEKAQKVEDKKKPSEKKAVETDKTKKGSKK